VAQRQASVDKEVAELVVATRARLDAGQPATFEFAPPGGQREARLVSDLASMNRKCR
jgi:hypothetical protein